MLDVSYARLLFYDHYTFCSQYNEKKFLLVRKLLLTFNATLNGTIALACRISIELILKLNGTDSVQLN